MSKRFDGLVEWLATLLLAAKEECALLRELLEGGCSGAVAREEMDFAGANAALVRAFLSDPAKAAAAAAAGGGEGEETEEEEEDAPQDFTARWRRHRLREASRPTSSAGFRTSHPTTRG